MTGRRPPTRRRPAPRARSGFTLIEILLAMVVFLSGIAGIYALLSTGLGMQGEGLQLASRSRLLDDVAALLQRELAAGRHRDEHGALTDVPATRLPDGSVFSARLVAAVPQAPAGPVLAHVRLARRERDLAGAMPVTVVLAGGPSPADAIAAARRRALHPEGER